MTPGEMEKATQDDLVLMYEHPLYQPMMVRPVRKNRVSAERWEVVDLTGNEGSAEIKYCRPTTPTDFMEAT